MKTLNSGTKLQALAATLAAILLTAGLSACGGTAIPTNTDSVDSDSSGDSSTDGYDTYDNTDTSDGSDSDGVSSEETQAYTWKATLNGHDDIEELTDVYTDNLLEVEVTGLSASAVSGTGYTAAYSCVRVQVEVEGETQTAFVTNTGSDGTGTCAGAVSSQTLDFSDRLTSGHGAVTITVSDAEYDNCRLYGFLGLSGCPMSAVYSSSYGKHTVGLNFTVHVNGN